MFKPIVCKAKTNITIPYSGTKKEKLEFIDRTARTFCENFDTYLQINNQKNFIKKKELIALFSELFPGLKINIGRVSSKEAGTDAATRREADCYIMRLKPRKSKNILVNILDYFRPLMIEKNTDNIESIKHETCHIISQSVRGNAFKNKDIRDFMARNGEFLEDMRFLLEERTNLSIFPAFYFQNKYKNKLLELFKNYKVNEYKQIHILSTLKRLIEEEKLAYNISTHGKSTTIDDINDRAYKVEKFLAFNKKLEVINSALKQKLINIRSNKKDLR